MSGERDDTDPTVLPEEDGFDPERSLEIDLSPIEVSHLLGKGGMAVVHLARQASLGRQVAVKMLSDDARGEEETEQLLKEARLTGRLEHPNIVPVHDIVFDPTYGPQVVLKHIDGAPWAQLMDDAEQVRERYGPEDLLEWNLQVIISVCRAAAFAHDRGVVHRDIKPGNIMVGRFGEVYLLDWGIAARLDVDPTGDLPSVYDRGVSGTRAYMAPEQRTGETHALGPWTDVYLIGATLYHALAGRPPHARTKRAKVDEDDAEPPPIPALPEHVSPELAQIVADATQPQPEARIQRAEELQRRLEAHLRHRGSHRLVERADARAEAARELRVAGDREEAERAAVEAAFGYRAALEAWPSNPRALEQGEALTRERIADALAHDRPKVAEGLLGQLEEPPAELTRRVTEALEATRAAEAERQRLAKDVDRTFGLRVRRALVAGAGLAWLAVFGAAGLLMPEDLDWLIASVACSTIIGTAALAARRETMWDNRLNRAISAIAVATMAATLAWLVGSRWLDLSTATVLAVLMLLWGTGSAIAAATIELRAAPAAVVWAAAFFGSVLAPSLTGWLLVGASALFIGNLWVVNVALARAMRDEGHEPGGGAAPPLDVRNDT